MKTKLTGYTLPLQGKLLIVSLLAFALFYKPVTALAATPTIVSAKVTSPSTITITYSEPVYSSIASYTNLSDAFSGRYINSLTGSGTNVISLSLNGNGLAADSSGYLTIGASTVSVSDSSPFASRIVNITDGQLPRITSLTTTLNNTASSLGQTGDSIYVKFTTNEPVNNPTITINGHQYIATNNDINSYSYSYTVSNDDNHGSYPVNISFSDYANNSNSLSFNINSTNNNVPSIVSLTSNASSVGTLRIGNSITFTLTPNMATDNASINGSYNGTILNWSTNNNGATYTATYYVTAGQNNQNSPLQLTNVSLTTSSGVTSLPFNGSDINKTIDANPPFIAEVTPVPTSSSNKTPSYTFNATEAGSLTFGGDCFSQTDYANTGNNTIVFSTLNSGAHNNCFMTITDQAGNTSNVLNISPFTITDTTTSTPATPTSTTKTPTTKYIFKNFLSVGSKGNEIKELQKKLQAEKLYSGKIDGNFTSAVETAVKAFQKKYKLDQKGYVGPSTRAQLNK